MKNEQDSVYIVDHSGILMLLAGGIFAFIKLWLYAAMLGAGALCCLAAAINFKNRSRDE